MSNTEYKKIKFSVKDTVLGEDLDPSNLTLPLLNDFVVQVSSFIRGSQRPNLGDMKASIEKGSLAILVKGSPDQLDGVIIDQEYVSHHTDLQDIDSVRARVIQLWQNEARNNPSREYGVYLCDKASEKVMFRINAQSNYQVADQKWVDVELYIHGNIYDLGGKSRSNVHVELENGKTIKIGTNTKTLSADSENRLYKKQLVRIKAKQNLATKELREERLVSFEAYNPFFDEDDYESMSYKVTNAWKSVGNITEWVENLRGSNV